MSADQGAREEAALAEGQRLAQKLFESRAHKGVVGVEIHIDQITLAAALALAFERGWCARARALR